MGEAWGIEVDLGFGGLRGVGLMVREAGGIGAGEVGEDARLCMGGKVRRGSSGSYGTCCRSPLARAQ